MPQPPHHKEEQPRGLTDQTVDAAHDFMEHAEEDKDKVGSGFIFHCYVDMEKITDGRI